MSEWHRPSIGDLVDSHWPGEWGTDPDGGPDVARVYRSTEIDDHGHLRKGQGVQRKIPRFRDGKALKPGDILVEASGGAPNRPVGRVALAEFEDGRHFTSNFVRTLRPRPSVDGNWLRWKLHWLNNQSVIWRHQQQTTGIINLKIESYLNQEIAAPKDQKEQERIASVFDLIDTQIEATEALIAKQERMRAGLMHDLFTRGVDENGELRPPREDAPHLYHQTELGWLPKGWAAKPVSDCVDSISDGPFGSNLKSEHYVTEPGVRVIRLQNVQAGFFDASDEAFVSEAHGQFLARFEVRPDDILIASLGDDRFEAGRACLYPSDLGPAINKADCFRARAASGVTSSFFLMSALNSEHARRGKIRLVQGVTRQRINTSNYKALTLPIPELETGEQSKISELLQLAKRAQDEAISGLSELRHLKVGLMQDLLTGTVSVAPLLEKEPA